ncbi:DHS-like NAD/FAD-binding domain-containing protein [Armillaria mellea]|nr:DHS-like NAD/FAD-binding domain-containing protein [Armillaria mellea]
MLPFLDNGSLRQYMNRTVDPDRQKLALDITRGMYYLHALSIVHGDLKGDNVLIADDCRAVIADFGISFVMGGTTFATSTSSHKGGTIRWEAPEVLNGSPNSFLADVYSLACVYFEVFDGTIPWSNLRDGAVIKAVIVEKKHPPHPRELLLETGTRDLWWYLMVKCWAHEPSDRPTVHDLMESLHAIGDPLLSKRNRDNPVLGQLRNPLVNGEIAVPSGLPPFLDIKGGRTTTFMPSLNNYSTLDTISPQDTSPSSDYKKFSKVLANSKHIIVVAGVGLSAASGIPTYHGAGGLWRQYNEIFLANPQAFKRDPSLVWQFYHYRREIALKAKPNAAHHALAEFSLSSIRSLHAPNSTFTLITQNVGGLSVIALDDVLASNPSEPEEQPRILETHGRLFDVKCSSKSCGHIQFDRSSPICEGLRGVEELVDKHAMDPDIPETELPKCVKCNALARPGVVLFEETSLYLDVIDKLVEEADLCLVVGTSSTVYPAAGYAEVVSQLNGGHVAVFNLDRTNGDKDADFLFFGPCEETVPKALGLNYL